jgi:hypothetical protein
MAGLAPLSWPLTNHPDLAFETGKEEAINLHESNLLFNQCTISIHIVSNDQHYGECVQ